MPHLPYRVYIIDNRIIYLNFRIPKSTARQTLRPDVDIAHQTLTLNLFDIFRLCIFNLNLEFDFTHNRCYHEEDMSMNTTSGIADVGIFCSVFACFFLNLAITPIPHLVLRLKFSWDTFPESIPAVRFPGSERRMAHQIAEEMQHHVIQHRHP